MMMRKMLISKGMFLPVAVIIALFVSASVSASPFGNDCEVYGSILIGGIKAQVGTEIAAVIDGVEIVRTTVKTEGTYEIVIPKRDDSNPESKGYRSESDVVTLYVDGDKVEPSFNPIAGRIKVDISISTTLEVKQTTWGKIKALFK